MKSGEKIALWFVVFMFIGVAALTMLMESKRKESPASGGEAQPARVAGMFPQGLDASQLPDPESRGAKALGLYCVQCHELPVPSMHTQAEWPSIMSRMRQRMEAMAGGMIVRILRPSEEEESVIAAYLDQYALREIDRAAFAAALETPAGQAFNQTCSRCHATPDPRQHTPTEWARVVLRMQQNMELAQQPVPDSEQLQTINDFLSENSQDAT